MHYSLRSRFQGTLLAAALGEMLAATCNRVILVNPAISLQVEQGSFSHSGSSIWSNLALEQARSLIQGRVKPLDPSKISQITGDHAKRPDSSTDEHAMSMPPEWSQLEQAGLAISLLPLMLFCHEDPEKLSWYLHQVLPGWQGAPVHTPLIQIVNYVLSLALHEQLQPNLLIPRLLKDLQLEQVDPALAQQLANVQHCLTPPVGIAIAKETLISPLSFALYSFLSTPDDFRLSLLRAVRIQTYPPADSAIICSLTGALSGAYNSLAGIPQDWRTWFSQMLTETSSYSAGQTPGSERNWIQLANELVAVWSGVTPSNHWLQASPLMTITTAPNVMRPR